MRSSGGIVITSAMFVNQICSRSCEIHIPKCCFPWSSWEKFESEIFKNGMQSSEQCWSDISYGVESSNPVAFWPESDVRLKEFENFVQDVDDLLNPMSESFAWIRQELGRLWTGWPRPSVKITLKRLFLVSKVQYVEGIFKHVYRLIQTRREMFFH